MFVMAKDPQFTWPVIVRVPIDDGKHEIQRFNARFRLLPRERVDALAGDTRALLAAALVGWSDIADEEKRPLQFSAAAAEALVSIPYVLTGLAEAYAEAISGGAARKN